MENKLLRVFHNELVGQSITKFNLYNEHGVLMYKKGSPINPDFLLRGNYIAFYKNPEEEIEEEEIPAPAEVEVEEEEDIVYEEATDDEIPLDEGFISFEEDEVSQFIKNLISFAVKKDADTIEIQTSKDNISIFLYRNLMIVEKSEIDISFYDDVLDRLKTIFKINDDLKNLKKELSGAADVDIYENIISLDWHFIYNKFKKLNAIIELYSEKPNVIELKDFFISKKNFEKMMTIKNYKNGFLVFSGPELSDKEKLIMSLINRLYKEEERNVFEQYKKNYNGLEHLEEIEQNFSEEKQNIVILKFSNTEKQDFCEKLKELAEKAFVFVIIAAEEINECFKILLEEGLIDKENSQDLKLFVFQALINKLCPFCSEKIEAPETVLKKIFEHEIPSKIYFFRPVGCDVCYQTGYLGKLALQEVFSPENMDFGEIEKLAEEKKYLKLSASGDNDDINYDCLKKVLKGLATLNDFYTITGLS